MKTPTPKIQFLRTLMVGAAVLVSVPLVSAQLANANSAPRPADDEVVELDVFTVNSSNDEGYGVSTMTSATRLRTPISDVPQSVSIVTSKFMEDIAAVSFDDSILYAPGVVSRGNVDAGALIRTFAAYNSYRNGVRVPALVVDQANIERLEIIKGPAAAIAGSNESGGFVNRITKKPESTPSSMMQLTVGNQSLVRAVFDTTGPLDADKKIAYRLVASGLSSEGARTWEESYSFAVYPSVSWTISPDTKLLVELEHVDSKFPSNEGGVYVSSIYNNTYNTLTVPDGVTPQIAVSDLNRWAPRDFNSNEPELAGKKKKVTNAFVTLTHRFSDLVSFRQGLYYGVNKGTFPKIRANHNFYYDTNGELMMPRSYQLVWSDGHDLGLQGDLAFTYDLAGTKHQTLVGYDFQQGSGNVDVGSGTADPISIFNPVYGGALGAGNITRRESSDTQSLGYFINHQSYLFNDRVILSAGLRRDTAEGRETFNKITGNTTRAADPDDLDSPMYGLTVKPLSWMSVYGVRSEAGAPTSQVLRYPNIAREDPRQELLNRTPKRSNDEFGIKSELLEGKLTVTIAHFDTMDNDATRPNTNASAPGGQEVIIDAGNRAQGWEVEFYGSPLPNLTVLGGYTNTKTSTVIGREFRGIPREKFQLFGTYDLRESEIRGWRLKAGVIYQTSVWGRSEMNYRIPGGTQLDLGADYSWGKYNFALNVQNATDEILPLYAIAQASNEVNPARRVFFTIKRSW